MEEVYIIYATSSSDIPVRYLETNLENAKIRFKQAVQSGFYIEVKLEQWKLVRNSGELLDCYYDEPCY
jgi:hypothetical protein